MTFSIAPYRVAWVHISVFQSDHGKAGLGMMIKTLLASSRWMVEEGRR